MAKGSLRVNGIIVDADGEIKASSGDAIVIREDDGSSVITVDTGGRALIGSAFTADAIYGVTSGLQVEGIAANSSAMSIFRNSNDGNPAHLILGKSRGGAVGGDTIVADNDEVGKIAFAAADGVDRASVTAEIKSFIGGTPGANDTPGELVFSTTADGAQTVTERIRIMADGKVGIGTTAPGAALHVYRDPGAPDDLGDWDNYQLVIQGESGIGDTAGILLSTTNDNYGGSALVHYDTGGWGQGDLAFYTKEAETAVPPVERMRIKYDGNVGIGTSVPVTDLTIEGTLTLKEQASADADTASYGQIWVKSDAPNSLYFTGDTGVDQALASTGKAIAMAIVFSG